MKVVHVITGLGRGGAETVLLRLLSHLDRSKFEPSVISLRGGGVLRQELDAIGIPLYSPSINTFWTAPLSTRWLLEMVRTIRPEILQGWMYHGNMAASIAHLMTRELKTKLVWNIRHSLHGSGNRKLTTVGLIRMGALLSRMPDTIIYNAEASAYQHEQIGYSSARRTVIPNGFDLESFRSDPNASLRLRAEWSLLDDTPIICLIGRVHPIKGHDVFAEAARLLLERRANVRFLWAGNGATSDNPAVMQLVEKFELNDKLYLLGERSDVANILATVNIATNCSHSEGFSNSIGEAMLSACPCVVTDVGDSKAIVGDTGVIVPSGDPIALANAWDQLLSKGPGDLQLLGNSARNRVLECYSLNAAIDSYAKLYTRLAEERDKVRE